MGEETLIELGVVSEDTMCVPGLGCEQIGELAGSGSEYVGPDCA